LMADPHVLTNTGAFAKSVFQDVNIPAPVAHLYAASLS